MIRRAIPRTSALGMLAATRFTATRAMATTNYRSTRGGQQGLTFEQAVMQGLATDRGLLVPENLPQFPAGGVEAFRGLSYEALALEIMSLYIGPDDIPKAELKDIIDRSYGTFRDRDVTPVVPLGVDGLHVLELFHGPTFAFKDVALQYLGNTFEHLLKKTPGASITVVGATSGDTGSSAIYGLRGKKGVECFIMFPDGRTSMTQRLQMISVTDPNIHNIALDGNFDDCQAHVKSLFNNPAFRTHHRLAAVNSINWARILAQIVYYVHAYLKVTEAPAAGAPAPKVSFSVPTGNFGDILAGFYAKQMGLPVDRLIVATNSNDILHRYFSAGDYSSSGVSETITPSMDIAVSSNFERFLYHMSGNDSALMAKLMGELESSGTLKPTAEMLSNSRVHMDSARASDAQVLATMKEVYEASGYVLDPHSAVGVAAARQLGSKPDVPMVCLACAHWAKFPDALTQALGDKAMGGLTVPEPLASLHTLPTRVKPLPNSLPTVQKFIEETCAARSSA